ncbi:MAG: TetR/AcrR family transcriptional regulator [Acidimicrobiales bacterium]
MSDAERAPLTREAIVEAAAALVDEQGLEALSLRPLARSLGVTAPALYAHVRDKQDLLRAVAEQAFESLAARFEAAPRDPADPLVRLRANGRAYIELAIERPSAFKVMFLFSPATLPGDHPDIEQLPAATHAFALAAEAVEDAIAAGAIRTEDPTLAALTLWAGMHGVATVLQMGLGLDPATEQALIDEVTTRLLDGYR